MTVTPAGPDGMLPGGTDPSAGATNPDSDSRSAPELDKPPTLDIDATQPIVTIAFAATGPADVTIADPTAAGPGEVIPADPATASPPDIAAAGRPAEIATAVSPANMTVGSPSVVANGPAAEADSAMGIEPTTGAPINALPRRVPIRTVSSSGALPTQSDPDGRRTAVRSAVPEPAQPVDDEPAFWLPIEEVHWDGRPVDPDAAPPPDRSKAGGRGPRHASRASKSPRNPVAGLAGLILLSLLASFFAWVSAEPLWLAFGRGTAGTATVFTCRGSGISQHCQGEFTAASGAFTAEDVRLTGVDAAHRDPGSRVTARMIDAGGGTAYVEAGTATRHLRWLLGLALVLSCAAGVVWATGALRLPRGRIRRWGVLTGLAGPLLIAAGFLFAAL